MKKILFLFFIGVSLLNASKENITVSIVPQKYFVKKIVGDKFDVNVMVKPGFSPATYEPKTSQLRKLTKSKLYFSIGVPFEKSWLDKFKSVAKNTIFVDTSKGIEKLSMQKHSHHEEHDDHDEESHHEHKEHHKDAHHEHEEHKHSGLDPHIWLDPILVKTQAKNIYNAIVKIDSQNKNFYEKNYKSFLKELDGLHSELKDILKPYKNRAFMVFHPSWGYFAKRYNLEQISVEVQGKEPKLSQLKELIKEAKEHKIKVVFVSAEFSQKSASQIAKNINGGTFVISPLATNWDKNLLYLAKEIKKIYK